MPSTAGFYMTIERAFDKLLAGYTRGLDFVLDQQRATLVVFLAHGRRPRVLLYIVHPQGVLSAAGHRHHRRADRCAAGHLVRRDGAPAARAPGRRGTRSRTSPATARCSAAAGPINNGFVILGLKPRDERDASADEIINRLRPQLAKVPGATLFMQAAQDLNIGGRTSRTQYQYTLQDSDIDELNDWAPKLLER